MNRILYMLIFFFILVSCDEEFKFGETSSGIAPLISVNLDRQVFDVNDRNNTFVEFSLDFNSFGGDLRPKSMAVYVASGPAINSTLAFNGSVKLKEIESFPSVVRLSLVEVAQALGIDINTISNNRSVQIYLELTTTTNLVYREGLGLNPNVLINPSVAQWRHRFFVGCKTPVEAGYYQASLAGTNSLNIKAEKEVIISKQAIVLEAANNQHLNFMRDIFSISDISVGLFAKSNISSSFLNNQPVGVRDLCGSFGLFNNALLTFPSPNPQATISINAGSWDAETKTLRLSWTGQIGTTMFTETTTFVKVRDL
jgi:hypothetical protein